MFYLAAPILAPTGDTVSLSIARVNTIEFSDVFEMYMPDDIIFHICLMAVE